VVAFEEEMTAERFDPFSHTAETTAFSTDDMLTIVFNDETAPVVFGDEAQAAGGGAGVTNDVGDGFAQSERKGDLFRDREIGGIGGCAVEDERDAGGVKGQARGFDLSSQAAGAIATDSFADFGECGAGDVFNIGDLGGGACVIAWILTVDEPTGELSFKDDN
jgi:hypothetical protein